MSTPTESSFDLASPRRPTSEDFNDVAKTNKPGYVPNPATQPNAEEWNFIEWLLLSLGRVTCVAKFGVTGGVSPALNAVMSANSVVINATITVTRHSIGDVSLTWPANTFPAPAAPPEATINGTAKGMVTATSETNGVRVRTWDGTAAAADLSFTVTVN